MTQPGPHRTVFLLLLLAGACGGQGVDFLPGDGTATPPDGLDAAAPGDGSLPGEAGPVWDWWDGDWLGWRVEPAGVAEVWHAVDGAALGEGFVVYVAGFRGAMVRFDSSTGAWTDVSPPTSKGINALWAAGPEDVFVCGDDGLVMRYHEPPEASYPEWTDLSDPQRKMTFRSIHGTGPGDVWVAGDERTLLHLQDGAWTPIPKEAMPIDPADIRPLLAVRALGPADVLAGGEGILMEWDGAQWTKLFSPAGVKYLAMASGGDSVWVGTDAGYLWLRDATGWVKKSAPVYYDYGALWVDGEGRVSATGPHPSPVSILWQGTGDPWSSLEVSTPEGIPEPWAAGSNPQVNGLWARGPEDLFVVTQQQQILRYAYHQ